MLTKAGTSLYAMFTMNKIKTIILAALLCCASNIKAQDGSTAYNFLNHTSSSRIYGLGGVNISTVEDDISITDQNPALLGPEMSMQTLVNYMRYVGESDFAGVKFAHSAGEHAAWSAGIQYFGYGKMTQTDMTGNILGEFSVKDIVFSGSYSHDINDRLRGGIAIKYAYSSYEEYTAMALATDLGINYYDPDRDLSLSLVVANLGGQIKRFNESYDRLPIDVRLGWTKSLGTTPIRLSITAWNLTKWSLPYYDGGDGSVSSEPEIKDSFSSNLFRHLIFGLDFVPSERFNVSVGYNYKTRTDMNTYSRSFFSGFSLGAGMKVKRFGVGFALSQPHTGATTFMLNLNLNFADLMN